MDYLCLAAGKGTRFGRLGSYLQKCMYPVGLTPFLEFSVRNLRRSRSLDIDKDHLYLIVGHHGEQVRCYFAKSYKGLQISYLEQPNPLGTGHALHLAYQAIKPGESVVAWLADAYISSRLFEKLRSHPEPNVQTVGPGAEGEKDDLRVSTKHGLVTQAWNGSEPLYDTGTWKLSPEVLALMTTERHGEYRMVPNLQLAIDRGHRLGFVKIDEWLHLGGTLPTPEENVQAVARRVLELEGAS